jgi:g-D-glutamyl-meso-diaminopimelate peptidase
MFAPDSLVTRAEFVVMLDGLLELESSASGRYGDVPKTQWYYKSVMWAKGAGLLELIAPDGGDFKPGIPITREEMAYIMAKAINLLAAKRGTTLQPSRSKDIGKVFSDYDEIDKRYSGSVATCYAYGIMSGGKSRFNPTASATRAEAVCILINMIDNGLVAAPEIVNRYEPYTSKRFYEDVRTLALAYPGILKTESYGKSVLGKDLTLVKLGNGPRKVLWVGGMHSVEVVTTNYLMKIIEEYAAAYTQKTTYGDYSANRVQSLLNEFTIYFAPMCNPDGTDIATDKGASNVKVSDRATWKGNANGVNLNRNFPFKWSLSTSAKGSNYNSYRGPSAGSEPETKALMELCRANDFEHMVSCHVQGKIIFWADKENGNVPGAKSLAESISALTGYTMLTPTTKASGGYAGGFENWFRAEFNRPGICLEFGKRNTLDAVADFDSGNVIDWQRNRNLILGVLSAIR